MLRIMKTDVCEKNGLSTFPGKVIGFDENLISFGFFREKFRTNFFHFKIDRKIFRIMKKDV